MSPLAWFLRLILPERVNPESRQLLKELTPGLVYMNFVVATIYTLRLNFEEYTFMWNFMSVLLVIVAFLLAFCYFVFGTLILDEYFDVPDWQRI